MLHSGVDVVKKLQTKLSYDTYEMDALIRDKIKKGYNEVTEDDINDVYPEFQKDLEKTAMWSILRF